MRLGKVIRTLTVFQRVATVVGNDSVGIRSIVADTGNNVVGIWNIAMNFGNNGAGACDVVTSVRNDYICVYPKFGLGAES